MYEYQLIKQQEAAKIDFAIMLNSLLAEKGFSQSGLAARAGKSKSAISRLMSGDSNLTVETMVSVLHALNETLVLTTQSRLRREYEVILSIQADKHIAEEKKHAPNKWVPLTLPAWQTESRR